MRLKKYLSIILFAMFYLSAIFSPNNLLAQRCDYDGGIDNGIDTAIGCIPIGNIEGGAATNAFIAFFFKWGIGIASGVAFLLILYSGFMILTSSGNPERTKAAQELLTAALSGLLLLVFSVFILEVIGVRILRLPGFGL